MILKETTAFGILIVDRADNVVYATGGAENPDIRHQLLEDLRA